MAPPALVATPGAVNANTYCTLAEAEAYFTTRLSCVAWTGATADNKNTALLMATRLLDTMYTWASWSTTETQALQWPRYALLDFLQLSYVADLAIPPQLKNAEAELAMALLVEDRTLDSEIETKGLTGLTVGPIELKFREYGVYGKPIPDSVANMVPAWWGRLRGKSFMRDLVRW